MSWDVLTKIEVPGCVVPAYTVTANDSKTDFCSQILGLMFSDFTSDGAADVATAPLNPPDVPAPPVSSYLHVLSTGEYKPRSKAPELV